MMLWAHTAKKAKIGPADASVLFFIVIWLFHMRMWTFQLAIGAILFFILLAYMRVTPVSLWYWVSHKISGTSVASGAATRNYFRRTRL